MSVGIDAIDNQHKKLVDIANRLHDTYMAGHDYEVRPKHILGDIIDELIEYTKIHFASEEKMMADAHYPKLKEHKEMHKKLVAQVMDQKRKFEESGGDADDLVEFLLDWLGNHIKKEDKDYEPYLHSS